MKNKKMRINLSMNKEYQDKLKTLAEAQYASMSKLIRRLIDEEYEREGKRIDKLHKERFEEKLKNE